MGVRAGNDAMRQKFTGYERDVEINLDFAQARYMSNVQGRFISVDKMFFRTRSRGRKTSMKNNA